MISLIKMHWILQTTKCIRPWFGLVFHWVQRLVLHWMRLPKLIFFLYFVSRVSHRRQRHWRRSWRPPGRPWMLWIRLEKTCRTRATSLPTASRYLFYNFMKTSMKTFLSWIFVTCLALYVLLWMMNMDLLSFNSVAGCKNSYQQRKEKHASCSALNGETLLCNRLSRT